MQITIFGASGHVGKLVVAEALARGYTVVAFVHSQSPFTPSAQLRIQQGDIYTSADIARAIQGSDAVVSCLGSWHTRGKDVLSSFTTNLLSLGAVVEHTRVITLTGVGVQQNPSKAYRAALRLLPYAPIVGKVFADADKHVQLLVQSKLAWTTICSPVMSNGSNETYVLRKRQGLPLPRIARKAVARALLDQVAATDHLREAVSIHRR